MVRAQLHLQLLQRDRRCRRSRPRPSSPRRTPPSPRRTGRCTARPPGCDHRVGAARTGGARECASCSTCPGIASCTVRLRSMVRVVLAVERAHPLGRPVRRSRRHREERREVRGLQRPGRVAVRHGDAAVDLGHLDDAHRIVPALRDGHQVVLADEPGRLLERLRAQPQHRRVVDVPGLGQLVEHLAGVPAADEVGDLRLDPHEVALGPHQHRVRRRLGVQRVPQLGGVQLGPEPGVAVGADRSTGAQGRLEPGDVVVQRLQRRTPSPARPRRAAPAPSAARRRPRR